MPVNHPFAYKPPPTRKRKSRFFRRYIRPVGKVIRYVRKNPRKVALASVLIYQLLDALIRDGPNSQEFVRLLPKLFSGKYNKKKSIDIEYLLSSLPAIILSNPHFQRYLEYDRSRRASIVNAMDDPLELREMTTTGVGYLAPKRATINESFDSALEYPTNKRRRMDYDDVSL